MALLCLSVLILSLSGLREDNLNYDVAVVLGNKVELDGTPSTRLAGRLDRALTLWNEKRVSKIIVSGGTGVEGFDEAAVMRDYLVERGVPEGVVINDAEGVNTWATAMNTRELMDEGDMISVVAVSQFFHCARCRLALKRAGCDEVSSSYARYVELRDFYAVIRELPGYVSYFLGKAKR